MLRVELLLGVYVSLVQYTPACRTGAVAIQCDITRRKLAYRTALSSSAAVTPYFRYAFLKQAVISLSFFTTANICRISTLFFKVLYFLHVAGRPAHDKFRSLLSAILLLLLTVDIPQTFQLSLWLKLLAGSKNH